MSRPLRNFPDRQPTRAQAFSDMLRYLYGCTDQRLQDTTEDTLARMFRVPAADISRELVKAKKGRGF